MKAVVLLSGGLDSAVTLNLALRAGYEVTALFISYGQRNLIREKAAARRIVSSHQRAGATVNWESSVVDFPFVNALLQSGSDQPLPSNRTAEEMDIPAGAPTHLPARNMVFLSIAASLAETLGYDTVWAGLCGVSPDCSAAFADALQATMLIASQGKVKSLETPLIGKTKTEIVRLGALTEARMALSWSCYDYYYAPCGVCDPCLTRAAAFRTVGIRDLGLLREK